MQAVVSLVDDARTVIGADEHSQFRKFLIFEENA